MQTATHTHQTPPGTAQLLFSDQETEALRGNTACELAEWGLRLCLSEAWHSPLHQFLTQQLSPYMLSPRALTKPQLTQGPLRLPEHPWLLAHDPERIKDFLTSQPMLWLLLVSAP